MPNMADNPVPKDQPSLGDYLRDPESFKREYPEEAERIEAIGAASEELATSYPDLFADPLFDWPTVKDGWGDKHPNQYTEEMWTFCRELVEEHGGRAFAVPALEKHERFLTRQIEAAEEEIKRLKTRSGIVNNSLENRVISYKLDFQFKRRALRRFMRQFTMTLGVPELSEKEKEELASGSPGPSKTIDAHPKDVLKVFDAVCEWVADSTNKKHPHTTTKEGGTAPSLCNHVAEAFPMVGQRGAGSKIKTVFRQVEDRHSLGLPEGGSNIDKYFRHREQIEAARDFLKEEIPLE